MDFRGLCALRWSRFSFVFAMRDFSHSSRHFLCAFLTFHRLIMEDEPARNFGYTNQEYADMLICYGACDQVGRRAAAEYRRRFPNRRHPDAGTFERVYQRVAETGCVRVRNPDGGRRRGARAENDEAILDCFAEDPTTSLRRTARTLDTSYSTCQRVMKEDLQHPYKYRRVHEIRKLPIIFYL